VRQALVESVDRAARTVRVPLGEGTEVLGAIWGAIARVREVVAARTDGAVRFASKGPEGAITLAPWLHPDVARGDRAAARTRGPAADVKLSGRRVIVADDDPGVTWFIADLLRTAGCTVFEALDGARALELAWEKAPELVVSDILMPGLDGFALCRALKRDVALRDTPVVLLSWKEDLLQRVRELGASAAAYLRKESDSRAIVARVREVIRPRARVEARIKANGEVRGRLDGLTVSSLMSLVCAIRPNARVSVRDATYLYEVEIRHGAPRRATRTAGDGSFQRGAPVLTAMLGVGAGRFMVADADTPVVGELEGTLQDQLGPALANARGAVYATTGARLMSVDRVLLDEDVVEDYLRATPEPARGLIRMFAEGASPRAVLLTGGADPALVEDVLADLAARGAVFGVIGAHGVDLLAPAVERADAIMRGVVEGPTSSRDSARPKAVQPSPTAPVKTSATPSSLADAVMREISDRSPDPTKTRPISSNPPPLVEPSVLRPRLSSNPPADEIVPTDDEDDRTDVDDTEYEAMDEELEEEEDMQPPPPKEMSIPIMVEASQPSSALHEAPIDLTRPRVKQERSERTPLSSVAVAENHEATVPLARSGWTYAAVLAAAAGVVWLALQARSSAPEPRAAGAENVVQVAPPRPAVPIVTFSDLAADSGVAPTDGVLELVLAAEAPIKVDGAPQGRGPTLTMPLKAGAHELLLGAEDRPRPIEIRAGKKTRLDVPEPP
jgi:CheY-like chemotaxis protein